MTDIQRETRRFDMRRRLRNAQARKRRAEQEIQEIEGELCWMDEEDALNLIKSWRGVPDWRVLLEPNRGTHIYMLACFFLERMGLSAGGIWADTNQMCLGFSVPTSIDMAASSDAVGRRRHAIETIAPFIIPAKESPALRFNVFGNGVDGFALELRLSPDLTEICMVRMVFGTIRDEIRFAALGEAVIHIQAEYPGGDAADEYIRDPRDAPGDTGEALRRALDAFIEGCRSAGVPIEGISPSILSDAGAEA